MSVTQPSDPRQIAPLLLDWYDRHGRDLPWRVKGGAADPYRVWLSEIMLQQTTVAAVIPFFQTFTGLWPSLTALASASLDDVLSRWAGLGYYSRARNLHACAQVVLRDHGGCFPASEQELLKLPGIGPYTAAAIASIGFGQRAVVVDGNVERVMARLNAIEQAMPFAKSQVYAAMDKASPALRCGDFAQAVMDLGATICTPRSPVCAICPLSTECHAFRLGRPEAFPVKAPRKTKPERFGLAYVAFRPDGRVLMRPRPPRGLLGGMLELPSSTWDEKSAETAELLNIDLPAPLSADWSNRVITIRHVFTHFALNLSLKVAQVSTATMAPDENVWADPETDAVPGLFQKAIEAARRDRMAVGNPSKAGEKLAKNR
jgi:A/G-specific adenine glycosylase